MFKGVVVLVPFPFTDLSNHKVRPALILQSATKGTDFIAAFISSRSEKRSYPFNITIAPSKHNGLKVASVLKLDRLATLQKKVVLGELGILEPALMKEVDVKLKKLFKL